MCSQMLIQGPKLLTPISCLFCTEKRANCSSFYPKLMGSRTIVQKLNPWNPCKRSHCYNVTQQNPFENQMRLYLVTTFMKSDEKHTVMNNIKWQHYFTKIHKMWCPCKILWMDVRVFCHFFKHFLARPNRVFIFIGISEH